MEQVPQGKWLEPKNSGAHHYSSSGESPHSFSSGSSFGRPRSKLPLLSNSWKLWICLSSNYLHSCLRESTSPPQEYVCFVRNWQWSLEPYAFTQSLKTPPFLKEVYPFTPSRFRLESGYSLSYLDEGKEDTLPTIFLHGNPTWSFYYRKAVLAWRELGRCIVPDHLGCGLSDKPGSKEFSYQLKDHANNIRNLVNSLHIENFNLVMHDWGGAIGMTAFGDEPERVRKITLLNTAAFPSNDVPRRILFCRLPVLGEFWVRAMNGFAFPATWMGTAKGLSESTKK